MSWTSKTTPQFCTSKFGVGSAAWTSEIAKRISQSFQDVNWMGWRTAPPFGVWIPPNLSKYWNAGQKKQTSESPWLFPSDPLIFTVITVRDWGAGIISLVGLVALIGFHRLRCRRINSLASLVHIVWNVQWCFASKRQTDRIQWEDIWNMLSVTYIIKGASLLSSTYSSPIAPFHSIHVHTSIRIDLRIHIWTRKTAPGCLNQFNKSCHLFLFQRCLFRIVFRPFKNHTPNSSLQILDFQIVTPISWFAPLLCPSTLSFFLQNQMSGVGRIVNLDCWLFTWAPSAKGWVKATMTRPKWILCD